MARERELKLCRKLWSAVLISCVAIVSFAVIAHCQEIAINPTEVLLQRAKQEKYQDVIETNLIIEAAEQNKDQVITEICDLLVDNYRVYNDCYMGYHTFGGDDIISNLATNIRQLLCKWFWEFFSSTNMFGPILGFTSIAVFLLRGMKRSGTALANLGVFLSISIFVAGFAFGQDFVGITSQTRLWLELIDGLLFHQ